MASIDRLHVILHPSAIDVTRFNAEVVTGPPEIAQELLFALRTLDHAAVHIATVMLCMQEYPDHGRRIFEPDITLEFYDEGMKLVTGWWNGITQWFLSNPDSTVRGIHGWFNTGAVFLLPMEKRLIVSALMNIATYDCRWSDDYAHHSHYRVRVVVSPTQWDRAHPFPIDTAQYTLHTICGTTLLQNLFLFLCGNKLQNEWGIQLIGMHVSDEDAWRQSIGQIFYYGEIRNKKIRIRDLDWDPMSLVWLMPVDGRNIPLGEAPIKTHPADEEIQPKMEPSPDPQARIIGTPPEVKIEGSGTSLEVKVEGGASPSVKFEEEYSPSEVKAERRGASPIIKVER